MVSVAVKGLRYDIISVDGFGNFVSGDQIVRDTHKVGVAYNSLGGSSGGQIHLLVDSAYHKGAVSGNSVNC